MISATIMFKEFLVTSYNLYIDHGSNYINIYVHVNPFSDNELQLL